MTTPRTARLRGFSLLEAIVALAILLAGVIGVVRFFPGAFRASAEAASLTEAAMLAQMKAEEIRRDDDTSGSLVWMIASRATPTDPIPFPQQPNLSYSFSGQSLLYPSSDTPRGDPDVARVIVRYSKDFRPKEDVLYELRFGH
jgi:type II secretory pathway pseudopilin PulG